MNPVSDPLYAIVNDQNCVEGYFESQASAEARAYMSKKTMFIVEYTPKVIKITPPHETT